MSRRRAAWPVALLLGLAALVRLAPPSPFLTWDEPVWTYRSLRFARALQAGDLAGTNLTDHPGVITMWAGAAGVAARAAVAPAASMDLAWVDALPPFDEDDAALVRTLAPWLPAARAGVAAIAALLVAATAVLLVPALGARTAILAGALMAVDPYLVAHGRVLQLDAILAGAIGASVAALASHVAGAGHPAEGGGAARAAPRYLLVAGALGAVAALEKSPALVIVPFSVAVLAGAGAVRPPGRRRGAIANAAWWLAAFAATYAIAWPAMWASPLGTLGEVWGYASRSAAGAREAVFFAGRVTPDPGIGLYVAALAFRLTPVAVLGLACAAWVARRIRSPRTVLGVCVAWSAVFVLAMGVGAKKFERYALPSVPALDVVAAVGLAGAAGLPLAARARGLAARGTGRTARRVAVAALVGLQGASVLAQAPYHLAWYSPLLGGGPAAARVLPVGWGEGMDLAAAWLNERPGAERLTVATPSVALLAPLFVGDTVRAGDADRADYVVLYVDDVQIGEPELVRELLSRTPEHVVRLSGVDYAWIYRGPVTTAAARTGGSPSDAAARSRPAVGDAGHR